MAKEDALFQEMSEQFEEVKKVLADVKARGGEATEAQQAKLDEMQAGLDASEAKFTAQTERLDAVETRLNTPAINTPEDKAEEEALEAKAFDTYVRKGERALDADEQKALSTDLNEEGGYLVPSNRAEGVIPRLREVSPVIELSDSVTISVGNDYEWLREKDEQIGYGWVAERDTRSTTTTPGFELVRTPVHEIYAEPGATQNMLNDTAWDVEGWLMDRAVEKFRMASGTGFISGTGNGQPSGIINHSDITSVNSGHATSIKHGKLMELTEDMASEYSNNAVMLMHRKTRSFLRRIQLSSGEFLWERDFKLGQPNTILGWKWRDETNLATCTGDTFVGSTKPIIFGDFKQGYLVVLREGVSLIRDNITSKGNVLFYMTMRIGGGVKLPEAFRLLNISA